MEIAEIIKSGASSHSEDVLTILLNLTSALVLGSLVAARPWRRFLGQQPPMREMVHAQVLIAVAGAIAVTVIGDSLARAFGLVGLGGFIRFRTGIRDPRDAAVFFLLIGLGMACGLGVYWAAIVAAGFVSVVLIILDALGGGKQSSFLRLIVCCTDARGAAGPVREALETFPVKIRASVMKLTQRELRFDLENPNGIQPHEFVDKLLKTTEGLVTEVEWESLDAPKGSM